MSSAQESKPDTKSNTEPPSPSPLVLSVELPYHAELLSEPQRQALNAVTKWEKFCLRYGIQTRCIPLHACNTACEFTSFQNRFYFCQASGNMHICAPDTCSLVQKDSSLICPVTANVYGSDFKAVPYAEGTVMSRDKVKAAAPRRGKLLTPDEKKAEQARKRRVKAAAHPLAQEENQEGDNTVCKAADAILTELFESEKAEEVANKATKRGDVQIKVSSEVRKRFKETCKFARRFLIHAKRTWEKTSDQWEVHYFVLTILYVWVVPGHTCLPLLDIPRDRFLADYCPPREKIGQFSLPSDGGKRRFLSRTLTTTKKLMQEVMNEWHQIRSDADRLKNCDWVPDRLISMRNDARYSINGGVRQPAAVGYNRIRKINTLYSSDSASDIDALSSSSRPTKRIKTLYDIRREEEEKKLWGEPCHKIFASIIDLVNAV